MSQLSQFSEGAISDIISDVDNFIQETGLENEMKILDKITDEGHLERAKESEDSDKLLVLLKRQTQFHSPFFIIKQESQFPPEQPLDLSTEEYPGHFNFQVCVFQSEQKTPWEYSTKLNKLFIGINVKFPMIFSLEHLTYSKNLYIRATPVFSKSQYFEEIVHRCIGHEQPQDSSNKDLPLHIHQHIMRCSNENTQYFGDKNTGERLSNVIPLSKPQVGTDVVKEFYQFVCKNSCGPSGMNRRPIDVIFTLENADGEVLGRRIMSVRVCSCPKRDKDKEESALQKQRISNGKRMLENEEEKDFRCYPLNINVVGKRNYLHVLTTIRDRMAYEILKSKDKDPGFTVTYNEVCNLLEKAKNL